MIQTNVGRLTYPSYFIWAVPAISANGRPELSAYRPTAARPAANRIGKGKRIRCLSQIQQTARFRAFIYSTMRHSRCQWIAFGNATQIWLQRIEAPEQGFAKTGKPLTAVPCICIRTINDAKRHNLLPETLCSGRFLSYWSAELINKATFDCCPYSLFNYFLFCHSDVTHTSSERDVHKLFKINRSSDFSKYPYDNQQTLSLSKRLNSNSIYE